MIALILLFVFGMLAGPAGAQEEEEPELLPHPHLLVLGVELDETGEPIGFRKCVDLAAGQALPLKAQHEHVHFGTAGFKLATEAGHAVVPAAPFPDSPFSNCAELIAIFFGE